MLYYIYLKVCVCVCVCVHPTFCSLSTRESLYKLYGSLRDPKTHCVKLCQTLKLLIDIIHLWAIPIQSVLFYNVQVYCPIHMQSWVCQKSVCRSPSSRSVLFFIPSKMILL